MAKDKQQKRKERYYYRSRRKEGRVVREYIGLLSDPVVQVLSRADRLEAAHQQAAQEADEQVKELSLEIERSILQLQLETDYSIQVFLLAEGFRWRRRQGWTRPNQGGADAMIQVSSTDPPPMPTRDEFDEMVEGAQAGKVQARNRLRSTLEAHPEIFQPLSDLIGHLQSELVESVAKGNVPVAEALKMRLQTMIAELSGKAPTPLERMLVDEITITWLDWLDCWAVHCNAGPNKKDIRFWEQRMERAHKRHLSTVAMFQQIKQIAVRKASTISAAS